MDAKEAQLQYMHLYKEMDVSYYALSCAQQLVPSEMDIYYAITVLGDGCRQRDICALALSRKQTINSALKKMEKQGLLRLESGKGREKHIYLTASGRRNADESVKPIYDAEQAAFAEMAEAEREQLVALTGKFIHLLQKQTAHLAPEFREKGEK